MPNEEAQEQSRFDIEIWKKILPYFMRYKFLVAAVAALLFLMALIDIALPLFMRYAVDRFIGIRSTDGIWAYAAAYIGLIAFETLLVVIEALAAIRIEMLIARDLKKAAFEWLQRLGLDYYNTHPVGSIIARMFSDTNRVTGLVAWAAPDLVWSAVYAIGAISIMMLLNWQLALIALGSIFAALAAIAVFRRSLLSANRKERSANSSLTAAINEGIMGAKASKALAIEAKNAEEFSETTQTMYKASLRSQVLNAAFMPLVSLLTTAIAASIIYRGSILTLENVIELGTFTAFISYSMGILEPISHASRIITDMIASQAGVERFTEILSAEPGVTDSIEVVEAYGDIYEPKTEAWEEIEGSIEFRNVSFKYPDGEGEILDGFSLYIPAGSSLAIVGETGAGKSTIVNLACRFYDPSEGSILIDGKDIRLRSQKWLHSQLGYVLQDPHLFSGTIEDNIRYGKLGATLDEIKEASDLVGLGKVVEKLEDGYNTQVGESGSNLSTGEKQLISFARAIINDPPILVLDEATSSVDTEIEAMLQQAIQSMLRKRTSIIIAHRLSTISSADMIIHVDKGRITEKGTHAQLLAKQGEYWNLYQAMLSEES
ncbi:MAG: ABC transporter ATP-binding protein/permease [Eubacteriaceae bacterium]|nr:ABC transporter ATP-binding protein/permease [Eubacteriaceae bacterium]